MPTFPYVEVLKEGQGGVSVIKRNIDLISGKEYIESSYYMNRDQVSRMKLEEIPNEAVFLHLPRDGQNLASFFMDAQGQASAIIPTHFDGQHDPYKVRTSLREWIDSF
jgi:hypothetical protein